MKNVGCDFSIDSNVVVGTNSHAEPQKKFLDRNLSDDQIIAVDR